MRKKQASPNSLLIFLHKVFLVEKLNNWIGIFIVILIAIGFGYLISGNILIGMGAFSAVLGTSLLIACLLSPELGLYINMLYIFSASGISRFLLHDQLPVGVITDVLVITNFVGLFFSNEKLRKNTAEFFKKRPAIYYTIIVVYLILELFNPLGHSFEGWLQVMRKVFDAFLYVFIAYNVLDTLPKIRRFIKTLFWFAVVVALYGCFQQWHGLLTVELNWVHADPVRFGLIFVFGDYRKFSFLGGPTDFGIIMAACSIFFIILSLYEKKRTTKFLYVLGSIFMLLGMSFSGTRTANAMIVGGIGLFVLLTFNKMASKLFAIFGVMLFLFLMYVPIYSNITLLRFRSTFKTDKDASYTVRETNRQGVQPFIWSHPFGAGLSTTGEMGKKYNPASPMAGFPTDSSYLNKALESGSVGLAMTLMLYFTILQYCIRGYFGTKDTEFKTLFAALLAFFFSYFLGEVTQEAVGLFTNMVVYFPMLAILLRLHQFSEDKTVSLANFQVSN